MSGFDTRKLLHLIDDNSSLEKTLPKGTKIAGEKTPPIGFEKAFQLTGNLRFFGEDFGDVKKIAAVALKKGMWILLLHTSIPKNTSKIVFSSTRTDEWLEGLQ